MTDITIPPEAVEAAARAIYYKAPVRELIGDEWQIINWEDAGLKEQARCFRFARAALRAALKAWPGAREKYSDEHVALFNSDPALILPLPPESAKEGA